MVGLKEISLFFSLGLFGNLSADSQDLNEVDWMARNAFFEARNADNIEQMKNVVQVVENRVEYGEWGDSVEQVITYPHNCEFSWYCDGKTDKISHYIYTNNKENSSEFKAAVASYIVALKVKYEEPKGKISQALFYHASSLKNVPSFFSSREKLFDDGLHVFYK